MLGAIPGSRRYLLVALALGLVLAATGLAADDPMYASGLITAVLCLALILRLVQMFPRALDSMSRLGVLAAKHGAGRPAGPTTQSGLGEYTRKLSDRLTLQRQWLAVLAIVVVLSPGWRIIKAYQAESLATFLLARPFDLLAGAGAPGVAFAVLGFLAELFVVAVVAVLVLRFIAIGWELTRLTDRFDLAPLFHHPDRCGGLKPLGTLSQLMALTLTVPGVVLAIWIVLGDKIYRGWLSGLLLILTVLAALTFFAPLWRIHKVMVARASAAQPRGLETLGRRIDEMTNRLLRDLEGLTAEETSRLAGSLRSLRGLYEQSMKLPVWPFDLAILARSLGPLFPLLMLSLNILRELLPTLRALGGD